MKACDSLLRAFAEACRDRPDIHLMMCGPDDEGWQEELVLHAETLGISDRVTWAGPLYGSEKWLALAAAELFILPSHCETFPVAILEALASRTPVLITNKVGIYREIETEQAGFVCNDDPDSLEGGLRMWLGLNGAKQAEYRSAAYRCFQKHFEAHTAISK